MSESSLIGYLRHPRAGFRPTLDEQRALVYERVRELGHQSIRLLTDQADAAELPLFERAQGKKLSDLPEGYHVLVPSYSTAFPTADDATHCLSSWTVGGMVLHLRAPEWQFESWISTQLIARRSDRAEAAAQLRRCIPIFLDLPRRIRSERSRLVHRLLLKPYRRRNTLHAGPGRKWEAWPGYPQIERLADDPEELKIIGELTDRKLAGETFDQLYFSLLSKRIVKRDGKPWSRTRIQDAVKGELKRREEAACWPDGHA